MILKTKQFFFEKPPNLLKCTRWFERYPVSKPIQLATNYHNVPKKNIFDKYMVPVFIHITPSCACLINIIKDPPPMHIIYSRDTIRNIRKKKE